MAEALARDGGTRKHSAFVQVVFRKSGEALDLGGKSVVGLGGVGSVLHAHGIADVDWARLLAALALGGALLATGIYLQAKAEET